MKYRKLEGGEIFKITRSVVHYFGQQQQTRGSTKSKCVSLTFVRQHVINIHDGLMGMSS